MQGRILDGLQHCQHGLFVPDASALTLVSSRGQGNLVNIVQYFLARDFSLLRLLPGLETFPSLATLTGMIFVKQQK